MTQHTKPIDLTSFGDAVQSWLQQHNPHGRVQLRIYAVRQYGRSKRINRNDWITSVQWSPLLDTEIEGNPAWVPDFLMENETALKTLQQGRSYGVEARSPDGMAVIASCYVDLEAAPEEDGAKQQRAAAPTERDPDSLEGAINAAVKKKVVGIVKRAVGGDEDDEDGGGEVSGALLPRRGARLIPVGDGTFMTPEQFQLTMRHREQRMEEKDADVQRLTEQISELRDKMDEQNNSTGKLVRETIDKVAKLGFTYLTFRMKKSAEEEAKQAARGKGGRGQRGRGGNSRRLADERREMEEMFAVLEEDEEGDEGSEEDYEDELPRAPRGRGGRQQHPWASQPSQVAGSMTPPPPYAQTMPAPEPSVSAFRTASGPPSPVSPFSSVLDAEAGPVLPTTPPGPLPVMPSMPPMPPPPGSLPNLFSAHAGAVSGPPVPVVLGSREPVRPAATAPAALKRARMEPRGGTFDTTVDRLAPVAESLIEYVEGLVEEVGFLELEEAVRAEIDVRFVAACRAHGITDTEILLYVSKPDRLAELLICAMTEEKKEELGDFVVDRIRQVVAEKASSTDWNALL